MGDTETRVYVNNPHSFQELKGKIQFEKKKGQYFETSSVACCLEGAIDMLRSWRSGIWDSPMTKSPVNCRTKTDDCQRRQTSYVMKLPWRQQCRGKIKDTLYIWYSHRLHCKSCTSGTVHRYLLNHSNNLAPELNVPVMSRKLEFKWDTIWQASMSHIQHFQHYAAWLVYLTLGSEGLIPV